MDSKERKAEYDRAYRQANKERTAESNKAWREANKERLVAYRRAWYKANKERHAGCMKAWYEANKEHCSEYNRAYQQANRERKAWYMRVYYVTHPEYRKRNIERNKSWQEDNREHRNEYEKKRLLTLAEQNPDGYVCDEGRCGEKHSNWKGGEGRYPKSTEIRVNRLIVLNDAEWTCDVCGIREATEVHHLDGTKDNHAIENLMPVCRSCHQGVFHNNVSAEIKKTSR